MAKAPIRLKAVLAPKAQRDIHEILKWSALLYRDLIKQAIRDIEADPERPGSQERPELAKRARVYHLRFSRDSAKSSKSIVHKPRHFLLYRPRKGSHIEVARILHDSRDLEAPPARDYR